MPVVPINHSRKYAMQILRKMFFFMFLVSGMVTLQACDNDGPIENAGEAIDEAAEDAGDAIEEVCEDATDSNCD
jgi:hypothetical protein